MPSLPGDTTDKRQSIANESFMGHCTWIVVSEKARKTKRKNCWENDPCPEVRMLIIYSITYYNIFLGNVLERGKGVGLWGWLY